MDIQHTEAASSNDMESAISDDRKQKILKGLAKANKSFQTLYPGDRPDRQPVHTVYGGAQLFKSETISKMRREPVIERLWEIGRRLQDGYNAIAEEAGLAANTVCSGLPPHTVAPFKDNAGQDSIALRSLLQQELVRRGILYLAGFNICYAHTDDDVEVTLVALRESLQVVAQMKAADSIMDALDGPPAEPVFRRA